MDVYAGNLTAGVPHDNINRVVCCADQLSISQGGAIGNFAGHGFVIVLDSSSAVIV